MSREHLLRRPTATADTETIDAVEAPVPASPQPVSALSAPVSDSAPARRPAPTSGVSDHSGEPPAPVAAAGGLMVGRADDPAEAAADAMADSALSRLRRSTAADALPQGDVHQHAPGCEHLRRSASAAPGGSGVGEGRGDVMVGMEGGALDSGTTGRINSARGSGKPLPGPVLQRMETAFDTSFSSVRIHDDSRSAELNQSVSAQAFTTGQDIFFGAGKFAPESPAGEHVLAHELAHVVQDGGSINRWPWDKDTPEQVQAKKDKKDRKAAEKQESADNKAAQKQSVIDQKGEKTRLGAERERGQAGRAGIATQIAADQQGVGPATKKGDAPKNVTSKSANDIKDRFELNLTKEKELVTLYTGPTMTPAPLSVEEAVSKAYEEAWLNADEELRAVRPPRETAAERLVLEIKAARTNANVRATMNKRAQRGSLLEPAVEKVYEDYVEAVDKMLGQKKPQMKAEALAAEATWMLPANADAKKARPPIGSALDIRALKDARERLSIKPGGAPVEDGLASAIDTTSTIDTLAGPIKGGLGGVGSIVAMTGKTETKALQAAAGKQAGPQLGLEASLPGPVGDFAKSIETTQDRVAKGKKDDDPSKVWPQSVKTEAGEGIKTVTGVLGGLLSSALNIMKFAKAVQTAHNERNARNILAATKAAADALASMAQTGKSTADMAKMITPGLTASVGSVIPGLNIFTSVMGMISNSMTMADAAMRVNDTDNSLFEAQTTKPKAGVNVLVYPMLRILQSYTKGLEKSVWDTAISISDFATGVATVASGGGYGIPVAVQAGVKVIDTLHSVGHFIADQVLVSITKKAQSASVQSLEGAAENSLHKDPAMAVDGIIISAVKGDPIATKFLSTYSVNNKPIGPDLLKKLKPTPTDHGDEAVFSEIRTVMMAAMGDDADPQYFYQKWKAKIGGALTSAKAATTDKWADTAGLAQDRNALGDGKARGIGWRIKMMFSTTAGHERSKAKTRVNKEAAATKPGAPDPSGPAVVMGTCGKWSLFASATPAQQALFAKRLENETDAAIETASLNLENSDEFQELMRNILADRAKASVAP